MAAVGEVSVELGDVGAGSVKPDYVAMLDALQILSVDAVSACRFASKMSTIPPSTFLELYERGRMDELANGRRRKRNCQGLGAFDLRTTRPDCTAWDFRLRSHREDAIAMVRMLKPKWVIGPPPCTPWCVWNWHLNYTKLPAETVTQVVAEGRLHLNFTIEIYKIQLECRRFVLHEHPSTAASWNEDSMAKLVSDPRIHSITPTASHHTNVNMASPCLAPMGSLCRP